MTDEPDGTTVRIIEIDQDELACRLAEAFMQNKRPAGMDGHDGIDTFEPVVRDGLRRAALAACEYVMDQLQATGATISKSIKVVHLNKSVH